jgi:hypothetical protein
MIPQSTASFLENRPFHDTASLLIICESNGRRPRYDNRPIHFGADALTESERGSNTCVLRREGATNGNRCCVDVFPDTGENMEFTQEDLYKSASVPSICNFVVPWSVAWVPEERKDC